MATPIPNGAVPPRPIDATPRPATQTSTPAVPIPNPLPPTPNATLAAAPIRRFVYGKQVIPDPGAAYTPQQVCQMLAAYYPELAHATIAEQTLPSGVLEYTFAKRTTTKGLSPQQLAEALESVSPFEEALTPLIASGAIRAEMQMDEFIHHHAAIREAHERVEAYEEAARTFARQCVTIRPTPLSRPPLGF